MTERTIIKNFPRSKLGAVAAGIYLLLVFLLFVATVFGSGGLHGGGSMASLFAIILTSPLSWLALGILDFLHLGPTYELVVFIIILSVCAIINAGVIYLLVGFVSRGLRATFRKLFK